MSKERDTKFAGFARAVVDELVSKRPSEWGYDEACLLLARRAYDLVEHACDAVNDKELDYGTLLTTEYMVDCIPDLPELPEEKKR